MSPQVIADRYELVELLGRGGMGAVWRARDRTLDREVAIKEVSLPRGLAEDAVERVYARTFREARSAARLDHPGIVTVHDVIEEDGRPWIVMRLVRAPALDRVLADEGPLPPARVAAIGLDLLDALRAAHEAGVVHRDVKPGNVLLPRGRAVLTDFGIAKTAGDETLTQAGAIVGSPAYLAPEQARYQRATPASDLWSLGATLYAAVEGRPPFQRPDMWGVMAALLADDPDPLRRAGPLAPVLDGLLRKDPEERLDHDGTERLLREVEEGGTAPAPASSPPVPAVAPPPPVPAVSPGEPVPSEASGTPRSAGGSAHPVQPTVSDRPVPSARPRWPGAHVPPGPPTGPSPAASGPGGGPRPMVPPPPPPSPPPAAGTPRSGTPARHGAPRWALITAGGVAAVALAAAAVVASLLTADDDPNEPGRTSPSPPASASAAAPGATDRSTQVPSGYREYRGERFAAAVPSGWKQEGSGSDVTFTDSDTSARRGIAVQKIDDTTGGEAMSLGLAQAEQQMRSEYENYRRVSFEPSVPSMGGRAAQMEFTFTKDGVDGRCRVRLLSFDSALYMITMVAKAELWEATTPAFDTFLRTFRSP